MQIVESATQPPAKCIVSGDIDGPFIDTGVWANQVDPYIYLHVPVVEYMARELLGMVPAQEVEAELAQLRDRLASYAAKVEQLAAFAEAHERLEAASDAAGYEHTATHEPAEEVVLGV